MRGSDANRAGGAERGEWGPASDAPGGPRGEAPGSELEPLAARIARLKAERDEAHARYNQALTALDRAIRPGPIVPPPIAGIDPHQLPALNGAWNILPAAPEGSGVGRKLTAFIWRVIGPYLQRQVTFNSLLVDHLNRAAAAAREAHAASEALAATLQEQITATSEFQTQLILFLQQITPYVDTSARDAAGRSLIVNEALSGLADGASKRWESLAARQNRIESAMAALPSARTDPEQP